MVTTRTDLLGDLYQAGSVWSATWQKSLNINYVQLEFYDLYRGQLVFRILYIFSPIGQGEDPDQAHFVLLSDFTKEIEK